MVGFKMGANKMDLIVPQLIRIFLKEGEQLAWKEESETEILNNEVICH